MGKYKALIFDIDGTVMPTGKDSVPSSKVSEAFRKYTSRFIISPATGRQRIHLDNLIKEFNLQHPLILMGGSQIIDHKLGDKVLWERKVDQKSANELFKATKELIGEFELGTTFIKHQEEINHDANIIYLVSVPPEKVEAALRELAKFPHLKGQAMQGWQKGTFDIHVVNKEANKGIAIDVYLELLGLKKEEVIAVGDGANDFDLFEHAGFKIAMGNADPKLKLLADLVVGDVSEDGVIAALEMLDS